MLESVEHILAKLVSFDTTSSKSNRALIDYVCDYLNRYGVISEIVSNEDGTKACLWATIGNPSAEGIVLSGHTDVVPVSGQKWISDPFLLSERDDKFFARGSADMKGFIACAMAFIPEFLEAKTGGTFHLALTYDEETNMSGAERLADYLIKKNTKPKWVWIGEPTGLSIVDQHKGVAAYVTSFTGVPGHSGDPDKGLNAISLAAHFMMIIEQAAKARAEKPYHSSRFNHPYTVFNLATIKGGTAENIIAGDCDVTWQVRAHPGECATDVLSEIEIVTKTTLGSRLQSFSPDVGMKTCTCFDIPPFKASQDNVGANTLKTLLKCDETHAAGFATEAGIFQKIGTSAVVCGPGFIEHAHQANEYIDKNQLFACVDLIRAVLLSSMPTRHAFNRS